MGKYEWRVGKEYREIRYELCDGVAKISINRPERRNAFTPLTVMVRSEETFSTVYLPSTAVTSASLTLTTILVPS